MRYASELMIADVCGGRSKKTLKKKSKIESWSAKSWDSLNSSTRFATCIAEISGILFGAEIASYFVHDIRTKHDAA